MLVILRYSEGSCRLTATRRSFGVPQDEGLRGISGSCFQRQRNIRRSELIHAILFVPSCLRGEFFGSPKITAQTYFGFTKHSSAAGALSITLRSTSCWA